MTSVYVTYEYEDCLVYGNHNTVSKKINNNSMISCNIVHIPNSPIVSRMSSMVDPFVFNQGSIWVNPLHPIVISFTF